MKKFTKKNWQEVLDKIWDDLGVRYHTDFDNYPQYFL